MTPRPTVPPGAAAAPARTPLRPALAAAAARLAAAGVTSPRVDAELLAAHLLGVPRSRLLAEPTLPAAGYAELVAHRAARVPLQHLTGRAGFRRLDLAVGPGVFVPRPETETLVEWCLRELAGCPTPLAVDLCAGSGAIALALADEHAGVHVHAVEREPSALDWLRRNVAVAPAGGRVRVHAADLAAPLPGLAGAVDLVVSNPPYVPTGARPRDPEVADHDPPTALYAGPDGLQAIRAVERAARLLLRAGGTLAVEHAESQGEAVRALLSAAGSWRAVADHLDLAGRPRFATARWEP